MTGIFLAGVFACAKSEPNSAGLSGTTPSTMWTPPPERTIVSGNGVVGGAVDAGVDGAASALDARLTVDAATVDAATLRDATVVDSRPGVDLASPPVRACDLAKQDCPSKAQACYRTSNAGTRCDLAGGDPEGTSCATDAECDKGLVCVSAAGQPGFCLPVCSQMKNCNSQKSCRGVLPGYEPIGFCTP